LVEFQKRGWGKRKGSDRRKRGGKQEGGPEIRATPGGIYKFQGQPRKKEKSFSLPIEQPQYYHYSWPPRDLETGAARDPESQYG